VIDQVRSGPITELEASTGWTVILPLKPVRTAKTRLVGLPDRDRHSLVIAMARDVCDAVLASGAVDQLVVVTKDPHWEDRLAIPGVRYVLESPADSLNTALTLAAKVCRRARPDLGIAALTADLPALRASELNSALWLARTRSSFVADASGVGTTLLAAPPSAAFIPQYGDRSREAHRRSGARELVVQRNSGLRQDVDTLDDLHRAQGLGVGHHTAATLTGGVTGPVTAGGIHRK
jgi:2-phospho-L-lactate guanylyltransferase